MEYLLAIGVAMFIGLLTPNLTSNWKLGALVALTAVCNSILSQLIAPSWAMISLRPKRY